MDKKSVGIIAEYNPFHNGHLYHLNRSKEMTGAEISIAAMSGNFVQRGRPAMADKWSRAEAAVKCGIDLVVEIPVVFACNSAAYFAGAGVEILENLGVDYISFGSESGNIEELEQIARAIEEKKEHLEELIRKDVKKGMSYPRAREAAVREIIGKSAADILDNPNNILALEYLQKIKSAKPVTVKRAGPGYNDLNDSEGFASATAIRKFINEGKDISRLLPGKSAQIFSENKPISEERLFDFICQKVFTGETAELDKIFSAGEGLGNKLKNSIRHCGSYEEVVEQLKSKRYTRTRIERFLMQILLDIRDIKDFENYIRVLALNERGSEYLKKVKRQGKCRLPVITNINKDAKNFPELLPTLEKDILAGDMYNLISGRNLYEFSDYVMKPFIMKGTGSVI